MSQELKELFILNERTMLVELNKVWISTIKEFRVILERDKGSKGDAQGRKKIQATREFTFIYHLVDYRSQYADYSEKDRLEAALKNSDLDPKFDYTKDEELNQAVEVYSAFRETSGLLLLQELKQGLHASKRVVRRIRQDLERLLDNTEDMTPDQIKELGGKNDFIVTISERLDRIIAITQQLPKTLKAVEELETTIKKELADVPQLRGGSEMGIRENVTVNTLAHNPFG